MRQIGKSFLSMRSRNEGQFGSSAYRLSSGHIEKLPFVFIAFALFGMLTRGYVPADVTSLTKLI
jgi:hypothetical protein